MQRPNRLLAGESSVRGLVVDAAVEKEKEAGSKSEPDAVIRISGQPGVVAAQARDMEAGRA